MPCYSPSYIHSKGDAILCSIFHKIVAEEGEVGLAKVIDSLDYDLIGLSKKQVWEWWDEHQKLDKQKMKEMK